MSGPLSFSALDVERWAETHAARASLPRLVRLLIKSTVTYTRVDFPSDEGIGLPGWDGVVDATAATSRVPMGASVWELSVRADARDKATEDYTKRSKRTKNPGDVERKATTYVAVSGRRWDAGDPGDWAKTRRAQKVWRDVLVIDANAIAEWIEEAALGVSYWLAEEMGRNPDDAQTLRRWWVEWSGATDPPISPELVLAGRDTVAAQLSARPSGPPGSLFLRCGSTDEGLAAVAAAILANGVPGDEDPTSQIIVVRTIEAWRRIAVSSVPLTLIPTFDDPPLAPATIHWIIVPVRPEDRLSVASVELPQIESAAAETALIAMGVKPERAEGLAETARYSLPALRRRLHGGKAATPRWALPADAATMVPALLAGRWDDGSPGDQEALVKLAGRSLIDVASDMIRWSHASDAPVYCVAHVWRVASREDSWEMLHPAVRADQWERFREVCLDTLGERDPAWDLPNDDETRWSRLFSGPRRRHSNQLRGGLAETIALLGVSGFGLNGGLNGRDLAESIVRSLVDGANGDATGGLWAALGEHLPLLAEAAPDVFLRGVGSALNAGGGPLVRLFEEAEARIDTFGGATLAGLLWALEALAWLPEYLVGAACLLATLCRLDPGGRWGNRSARSLREVLTSWHPQTAALLGARLEAVKVLRVREPVSAWNLMLALLPSPMEMAEPTFHPRWREWGPRNPLVSTHDFRTFVETIAGWLVDDAAADAERWTSLVRSIPNLPDKAYGAAVQQLGQLATSASLPGHLGLVAALRTLIAQHRNFPTAKWAMPAGRLQELERIYLAIEPTEPIERFAWLFAGHPSGLFVGANLEKYDVVLHESRVEALRAINDAHGLPGLERLAAVVERAWTVGWTAAALDSVPTELLDWPAADDQPHAECGQGMWAALASQRGRVWAEDAVRARQGSWRPEALTNVLLQLVREPWVWAIAQESGSQVEAGYWARSGAPAPEHWLAAAPKYLEFKRPLAAFELLAMQIHKEPAPDPALVITALIQAGADGELSSNETVMFQHNLGEVLAWLTELGLPDDELGRLEWAFLPVLEVGPRLPEALLRKLTREPDYFVELVAIVYRRASRAASEERPEQSQQERAAWERAYQLLQAWRTLPGSADDSVDAEILAAWVQRARDQLVSVDRLAAGDAHIGRVLSRGPEGSDGVRPHEAVRDLIESLASESVEGGFLAATHESRGVTMRGAGQGGLQERELADSFDRDAAKIAGHWWRTGAVMRQIAASFRQEARWHDENDALMH